MRAWEGGTDGRTVRSRARRRRRLTVHVLVAAAAVVGATSPVAPGGVAAADRLLGAAAAATLAYAGRRAQRWSLPVPAAVGLAFAADPVGRAFGAAALAAAVAAGWRRRRDPRTTVLSAALSAGALLRMGDAGFHGATALLAAAAAAPVLVSGWRKARPGERRAATRLAVAAAVLAAVAAAGAGLALLTARGDLARGQRALERGVAAARAGDDAASTAALEDAAEAFGGAAGDLDAWWARAGRAVPVLGHNLRAVSVAAEVAADVSAAGAAVTARAGGEELEVRGGRVPVDAIAALAEPAGDALRAVGDAERRAAGAASPWLLPMVQDRYDRLRDELAEARPDVELAVDAIAAVPRLLGADRPLRYLVLFVTPVEARPTGFPGNYADVVVADGILEMTAFGRITDLEAATPPERRALDMPAEYHQRYERFRPARFLRNLTATPDFPTVAETVRQLYPQVGGPPLDGVLTLDPAAIAALLRLTGPVVVPDLATPITADNAERFLLRDQYLEFAENPDRIDALETLGQVAFERLTTGDLPGPTDIADVLAPVAHAGHLRIVSFDPDGAAFLDSVGVTGRLAPVDGDALAVTNINSIGGKIDLFLERDVAYDVDWDATTGALRATATVTLRNTTPSAGLPDYVVGNVLEGPGADLAAGTNRTYLSVFTPWTLEGATLDGRPVAVETHTEAGRWVYSTLVDLAPDGGTATVSFELGGHLAGPYRLALWPQLLPRPDHVAVTVDASEPLTAASGGMRIAGSTATATLVLDAPAEVVANT